MKTILLFIILLYPFSLVYAIPNKCAEAWLMERHKGTDLSEAELRGEDLSNMDLRDADLYKADLTYTDLYRADLRGARLEEADFHGADLTEAKVTSDQAKYLTSRGLSGFVVVE